MPIPYHLAASPSFYLVHRFAFLTSLSDIRSHSLQDCPARDVLPRSETMAETTPLLPRANRPPHGPPITLRICLPHGFLLAKSYPWQSLHHACIIVLTLDIPMKLIIPTEESSSHSKLATLAS